MIIIVPARGGLVLGAGALGERYSVEFRKQIKGLASLTGVGVGRNVGHIVGRFSRMFGEGMKLSRSLC
jgi:hypothetical protein